ncbi:acetyl-CoA carboxylase biotin carboxyl carrier protein subunit [Flavobacteriaceae sp. LMIT009]
MSEHFKVKVNDKYDFDISKDDVSKFDIVDNKGKYHILKDSVTFNAELANNNFQKKSYSVKVNGNTYDVAISDELDKLINEMGFSTGTNKQINTVEAPMPGLILDIAVAVGQEVKEDDTMLILEAMKMENVIVSHRDGIIKSINVAKNEAVEKKQLLIEFE